MHRNIINQKGQSLLELMIAMAIFVLVVSSIMFLVLDAHTANRLGGEHTKAALLVQEGHEGAMSIGSRGWKYLINGEYGLDGSSGQWELQGVPNIIDDRYVRKIIIDAVNRDGTGAIVETGGTVDYDTKKITAITSWDFTTARPAEIILETYITNWRSIKWKQTTQVEFDQGTKNQVVSTAAGDGELELDQTGGVPVSNDWNFDIPANYAYDSNKIEINASRAQLRLQSGSISGGTANAGFDADIPPWTYSDWDQDGGEVNVTGSWDSPAGNPGGYAGIGIPLGKGDEVGGFFEQSFAVTENNPTTAYVDFDATVSNFNGTPQQLQLYVFVDSTPGAPLAGTEIWTSGPLGGTMPWTPFGSIDITSRISTAGTYYLKLAVWVVTVDKEGPFDIGFDNALAYWESGAAGYPTDNPSIQPTTSFQPASISAWSSFQEVAAKNGGEVYYQLSDDDGATWQYWDGGAWAVAGAADYNTATVVDSNIASFPTANGKLMFNAFLSSDGSQQVQLDTVRVTYDALNQYESTFDVPVEYTFDAAKIEVVSSDAQLVNMGGGSSGGTANAGFDADIPPWTYSDWDQDGGEVNVTGSWDSPAGNPGGYAGIGIPLGKGDEVGGFFEQSFAVTENNPTTAYVDFDATVSNFNGTPQQLQLYVFVDSTPGAPLAGTEIWTSGPLGGTMPWTPFGSIDITSRISTAGTYYLKLAVWVVTVDKEGPFDIGFDNALAYWESGAAGYPTDNPSIQPTTSFQPASISAWSSFQEVAAKNGGEVYYQLSDDDGATWQYWDGGAWAVAGAADYNTATVVDSNIASFPTANGKLMFNAFLSSDGSQQVQLDTVRVTYVSGGGSGYYTDGTFESSTFDTMSIDASYNYIVWTEITPPSTRIEWQLRTASTEAGLSSAVWVGPDGTSGTYYQNQGEIIEIDLAATGTRWIQYRAFFYSDGTTTPVLQDVTLDYEL